MMMSLSWSETELLDDSFEGRLGPCRMKVRNVEWWSITDGQGWDSTVGKSKQFYLFIF
jgi:hypothetical protein